MARSFTAWAKGDVDAAIQLEHLSDEVSRSQQMRLCAEHTVVELR